ncbi:bifunctional diguanylate cyclase/phosphodiesterase, partial [Bradyrhizobium sp.]|uniref:putative bifunctional diguanylate cyclase/phosphodiesterase n=1 Tax=Bradyrhizobium sp. TaxID=376 RepID=UPI0025BA854D
MNSLSIAARMRLTAWVAVALLAAALGCVLHAGQAIGASRAEIGAATAELNRQIAADIEFQKLRSGLLDAVQAVGRGDRVDAVVWNDLRERTSRFGEPRAAGTAPFPSAVMDDLATVERANSAFAASAERLVRLAQTDSARALDLVPDVQDRALAVEAAAVQFRRALVARADEGAAGVADDYGRITIAIFALAAVALGVLAWHIIWVQRRVVAPINGLILALDKLATNEAGVAIAGTERGDELGALARGVAAFRQLVAEYGSALHRVEHVARHDTLTGLPNRFFFEESLKTAIMDAATSGAELALLCLDVDHFKDINDSLGHASGDEVLRDVAEILRAEGGDCEIIGRIGGDEFAIVQTGRRQPQAAQALAEKLLSAFEGRSVGELGNVGISIGIAVFPRDAVDEAQLRHNADLALYRAKHAGRGRACVFTASVDAVPAQGLVVDKSPLSISLPGAMAAGQMRVFYQPKLRTRTQEIDGCEALVRWEHPERGLLLPDRFVPIAERTGIIRELTERTITQVVADQATLVEKGCGTPLYANVSGCLLADGDFAAEVLKITAGRKGVIGLEITETGIIGNRDEALRNLHQFVEAGLRIAIDDYGSGMSSLSYLKQL